MKMFIIIVLAFSFYGSLSAQNSVTLLNGKTHIFDSYIIDSTDGYFYYSYFDRRENLKTSFFHLADVYSITRGSLDSIVYSPVDDSEISVFDMGYFVAGKRDALDVHKSYPMLIAGAFVGAGSLFLPINNFIGLTIPAAFCTGTAIISPSEQRIIKTFPEMEGNEYFISGYQTAAKNQNLRSAVYGSIGGIILTAIIITSISGL